MKLGSTVHMEHVRAELNAVRWERNMRKRLLDSKRLHELQWRFEAWWNGLSYKAKARHYKRMQPRDIPQSKLNQVKTPW